MCGWYKFELWCLSHRGSLYHCQMLPIERAVLHKRTLITHSSALWTERMGRYITLFDFCFVNKWQRRVKLSSTVRGSRQTAPNMARKGRSGAAAYPPNWGETPTDPLQPSQLSSINSFHAGLQPEILRIPQPSYLKFISNNCSIKGNVCTVTYTPVIVCQGAGLPIHVAHGYRLLKLLLCLWILWASPNSVIIARVQADNWCQTHVTK